MGHYAVTVRRLVHRWRVAAYPCNDGDWAPLSNTPCCVTDGSSIAEALGKLMPALNKQYAIQKVLFGNEYVYLDKARVIPVLLSTLKNAQSSVDFDRILGSMELTRLLGHDWPEFEVVKRSIEYEVQI